MTDGLPALLRGFTLAPPGQAAILLGATVAFLPLPDVDQLLLRLLRHRSALTHSVLLPLGMGWLLPDLGPALPAGVALGTAVHLAADALSPSVGYGRVWWPWPFRGGLGGLSRAWLLLHALLAAWLALAILPASWRPLAGAVGALAALGYGLARERSLAAALLGLVVVLAGQGAARWLGPS